MARYRTIKELQNGTTMYPPGSIVELREADATWLIDIAVIEPEPVSEAAQSAAAAPVVPPKPAPSVRRGCRGCGW